MSTTGKPYVVVKASGAYLKLDGPYGYPVWVPSLASAEVMSHSRASQCANAHGGTVQPVSAGTAAIDAAAETQVSPWSPFMAGGG